MKLPKITPKFVTKIMTVFILGWFLFANYGIHFTTLHTHHHESDKEKHQSESSKEHNCLVCDFQLAIYEPLHQTSFSIEQKFSDNIFYIQPFRNENYKIIGFYHILSLRGPPVV